MSDRNSYLKRIYLYEYKKVSPTPEEFWGKNSRFISLAKTLKKIVLKWISKIRMLKRFCRWKADITTNNFWATFLYTIGDRQRSFGKQKWPEWSWATLTYSSDFSWGDRFANALKSKNGIGKGDKSHHLYGQMRPLKPLIAMLACAESGRDSLGGVCRIFKLKAWPIGSLIADAKCGSLTIRRKLSRKPRQWCV